jgi:hypothetical protein
MKIIRLAILSVLAMAAGAAAQEKTNNQTSDEEANRRFWQCEVPGGAYVVALDRIAAVGKHEYLIDGGFLVTEVTIDTIGNVTARFYYGEPYTPRTEYATGEAVVERARQVVDTVRERTAMTQLDAIAVKHYPTTTHAKTVEFKFTSKANLEALFQSVNRAWMSGRGTKFTVKVD